MDIIRRIIAWLGVPGTPTGLTPKSRSTALAVSSRTGSTVATTVGGARTYVPALTLGSRSVALTVEDDPR